MKMNRVMELYDQVKDWQKRRGILYTEVGYREIIDIKELNVFLNNIEEFLEEVENFLFDLSKEV